MNPTFHHEINMVIHLSFSYRETISSVKDFMEHVILKVSDFQPNSSVHLMMVNLSVLSIVTMDLLKREKYYTFSRF
jgi:hypothetical protein